MYFLKFEFYARILDRFPDLSYRHYVPTSGILTSLALPILAFLSDIMPDEQKEKLFSGEIHACLKESWRR